MANKKHLNRLLRSVDEWNTWIKENPYANIDLSGAELRDLDLRGSNLTGVDLCGVIFSDSNLSCSNLMGTNLKDVDFTGTNLTDANLIGTNLTGANLKYANLTGAILTGANIQGTIFNSSTNFLPNWWTLLTTKNFKQLIRLIINKWSYTNFIATNINDANTMHSPLLYRYVKDQQYLQNFRKRYPITFGFWKILSDCGSSMAVVGFWSFIWVMLFAWLYGTLPWPAYNWLPDWWINIFVMNDSPINLDHIIGDQATLSRCMKTIFVSFDIFSNLGLRITLPRNTLGAFLMIAESIMGFVSLGMLISVLANRFARRS